MTTTTTSVTTGPPTQANGAALSICNLTVTLPASEGRPAVPLVRDVSLEVRPGECLGIVGESGAGKSLTCYAALGLVQRSGLAVEGEVALMGRRISGLSQRELMKVRGDQISIIFQEPSVSLDPSYTVGNQIAEVVRWHKGGTRRAAWERSIECLQLAGVPNPERRAKEYPHTLSGGLRQRAMIALAISCEPEVLIADEATTALDVTIQAQILSLLRDLRDRLGMALIVVTHDLGVVADSCEQVAVMYGGQVVESGPVDQIFHSPTHAYTQGLLDSMPSMIGRSSAIRHIAGVAPPADLTLPGGRFAPRCTHTTAECVAAPPALERSGPSQWSRCVRHDQIELRGVRGDH